tara:strand:+ start:477 stop:770 length:294 start_codon:yes stop_codon:yes gene_type:complete
MKLILKVILSVLLIIAYLLTFYNIGSFKIEWVEKNIISFLNSYIGDYSRTFFLIIFINLLLIIFIIPKKIDQQQKVNQILSIFAYPFYNVFFIWKNL